MEETMKNRFNKTVLKRIAKKGKNSQLFTTDRYNSLIMKVKEAKSKTSKKLPQDYQRLAKYDVIKIGTSEKLIAPVKKEGDPIIYYAHLDETFQIIHECHISIGHGGRVRMMKKLKSKYKNVTAEMVTIYLNLCDSCQKKKSLPKKGVVVQPISNNELNSRGQIDLIDMQSQPDDDYKFIMIYEDYLTKFVQLRPLKSKRPEEIAHHLLDIFTIFGAPNILESCNGREFAIEVLGKVCEMWPELKMVHGQLQHSQMQGAVERANKIETMLCTWMESNERAKWSEGVRFVQFMRNRGYHAGINRSPYEAMFGCEAKVGLNSFLPQESMVGVRREEELEVLLKKSYKEVDKIEIVEMEFVKTEPQEDSDLDEMDR